MNWIKTNKKKIAAVLAALIALFGAIAGLTPTDKDDAIADKLEPLGDKLEAWAEDGATNNTATNQ